MPVHTAEIIFVAVASVMGLIWLAGIRFALSRLRSFSSADGETAWREDEAVLEGEALVPGAPDAVSRSLAERLTDAGAPGTAAVKLTERTASRVAFERMPGAGGLSTLAFDRGEFDLSAQGNKVRVRYRVSLDRFRRTMGIVTFLVCFAYGGIFVVGTPILVWTLAVRSEDPNVRWQVLQTAQMVHGVWPPFLIGSLSSRFRNASKAFFETLLANLSLAG